MATAIGNASPTSSPRLPSPPPYPEVQLGPNSPGIPPAGGASIPEAQNKSNLEGAAMRRIRPGTKAADMASGPPLVPLSELDTPFQLQEHLKALHYLHTHTKSSNGELHTIPLNHATALTLTTPPQGIDRSLWLYELCRLLVMSANQLICAFFADSPPCSAATCPEMRASEWQYLCAVHEPPKSCCAIDYSCHTLDWAANTLTSQKHFPSRLTLGSEATGGSQGGVKQLTNIMRRVYRIFAHAWFQHRSVFWQVEGSGGLYIFFKTVCDVYSLVPEENYTVPREAEGVEGAEDEGKSHQEQDTATSADAAEKEVKGSGAEAEEKSTISTGATTRRHKGTPSVGSAVGMIPEGEEDDEGVTSGMKGLSVKTDPTTEEATDTKETATPTDTARKASPPNVAEAKPSLENQENAKDAVEEERTPESSDLPRTSSSESVATMVNVGEESSTEGA